MSKLSNGRQDRHDPDMFYSSDSELGAGQERHKVSDSKVGDNLWLTENHSRD